MDASDAWEHAATGICSGWGSQLGKTHRA
eukprot:SAG31_NODE_30998_length_373_cov_1.317518_1_plen_28_part_01